MLDRRRLCGALFYAGVGGLCRPAIAAPRPRRIVSLDYALTETMLVLGVPPIAMPDGQDWDTWVVDPSLPSTVANLGSDQEINLELLARA